MIPVRRKVALALACVVQLAVPASLVVKHEQTRSSGTPWRFQTAPVDPSDPYRGRYVRLGYAVEATPVAVAAPDGDHVAYDQRVYAELAPGSDGFARLVQLHRERPEGVEYIDVFARAAPNDGDDGPPKALHVHLPFDRFYLPEHRAPQVEQDYLRASREAQANTWVEVRVLDGHAALVSLVLDGEPVR